MARGKRIIITGDDLGLSNANNAGILAAYEHGVLTTTCLMVSGDAADEGIDIARRHPALAVGLHIAFSDTRPAMPAAQVPMLVQSDGRFPPDDHALKRALRSAEGRRQIRDEIHAQFRAFRAAGIVCDHVNTHRNAHRHPLLALMVCREAARFGVTATRIPYDPPTDVARRVRDMMLRYIVHKHGMNAPDRCIGRDWQVGSLVELLAALPSGSTTELYFHPATESDDAYAPADLPILLDAKVRSALAGFEVCNGLRHGRLSFPQLEALVSA